MKINFPVIGNERNLPIYVCGVGVDYPQDDIYRGDGYNHLEFVFFTEGTGEMGMNDELYQLKPGYGFFMQPGVPHYYRCTGGEWRSWWVCFEGGGAQELLQKLNLSEPKIYDLGNTDRLQRIIRRIYNSVENDKLFGNYYASSGLYDFILEFYKLANSFGSIYAEKSNEGIERLISLIETDYPKKITMKTLCEATHYSEVHICRLFKKHLGMRPMEYVNQKRIQEAKLLLHKSYLSIEKISEMVGIESQSYFGLLFKRYEGISPSAYRDMMMHTK